MRDAKADLEVCQKATKGPWKVENAETTSSFSKGWKTIKAPTGYVLGVGGYFSNVEGEVYGVKIAYSDAEFIALAREALPWWINRAVELDAEVERLREALEHIAEYWNRNRDDGAMHDALWHIIETAEQALEGGGE